MGTKIITRDDDSYNFVKQFGLVCRIEFSALDAIMGQLIKELRRTVWKKEVAREQFNSASWRLLYNGKSVAEFV